MANTPGTGLGNTPRGNLLLFTSSCRAVDREARRIAFTNCSNDPAPVTTSLPRCRALPGPATAGGAGALSWRRRLSSGSAEHGLATSFLRQAADRHAGASLMAGLSKSPSATDTTSAAQWSLECSRSTLSRNSLPMSANRLAGSRAQLGHPISKLIGVVCGKVELHRETPKQGFEGAACRQHKPPTRSGLKDCLVRTPVFRRARRPRWPGAEGWAPSRITPRVLR